MTNLELSQQIDAFEQEFFAATHRTQKPASAKTTWRGAYEPYLRKLEAIVLGNPSFSLPEAIDKTLQFISTQSRSRQIGVIALVAFATFMQLEIADIAVIRLMTYNKHVYFNLVLH